MEAVANVAFDPRAEKAFLRQRQTEKRRQIMRTPAPARKQQAARPSWRTAITSAPLAGVSQAGNWTGSVPSTKTLPASVRNAENELSFEERMAAEANRRRIQQATRLDALTLPASFDQEDAEAISEIEEEYAAEAQELAAASALADISQLGAIREQSRVLNNQAARAAVGILENKAAEKATQLGVKITGYIAPYTDYFLGGTDGYLFGFLGDVYLGVRILGTFFVQEPSLDNVDNVSDFNSYATKKGFLFLFPKYNLYKDPVDFLGLLVTVILTTAALALLFFVFLLMYVFVAAISLGVTGAGAYGLYYLWNSI